ncbi:MAG: Rid family hydrolase [Acidimicrobiia bacterium]|nr:Rid family hydrolase [Acidimicrobiia bacterium]
MWRRVFRDRIRNGASAQLPFARHVAGATMADMYFLTIYVTDMRVYMDHGEIRKEYLSVPYPASTVVQVGSLAMPDWFIELEASVYLGD